MKTVGNDLVRHQLHENRKWYLGLGILSPLCSTCTKQKFKIGGINRLFSLIQLIRPLPHNLTVVILGFYHNPIFL